MPDPVQLPIFIRHVVARFPGHADLILRSARSDGDFCSLCEDYAVALEAVRRLEASDRPIVESRIAEYRVLVSDLEGDIQRMLRETIGRERAP
jgi:hypothetical protein